MDANPPTTADYAWSEAQHNALSVKDALVLIGWLAARVNALEDTLGALSIPLPEMPSQMNGFGCYPRRDEAVARAMKAVRRA